MTSNVNDYTSDTIKTYEGAEYVRKRPNLLLINGNGAEGIDHMVWEYVTNSMDEFITQKITGEILLCVAYEAATQRFQLVIADKGRGIPAASLHNVYLKLGTSGKIDSNSAYRSSTGEFGYGAKAGSSLSKCFRAASTNYLEDVSGSLLLHDGSVVDEHTEPRGNNIPGVILMFEPDTDLFFKNAKDYGSSNYLNLVEMCRKLNVFNPDIDFTIVKLDCLLDEAVWTCPISDLWDVYLPYFVQTGVVEYRSTDIADKSEYLLELWRVRNQPSYREQFVKMEKSETDKLRFDLRLFFLKKSITGNPQYFIAVNNVALADKLYNSVTLTTLEVLRELIAPYQDNEQYKQFVLEQYNFSTMLLAVNVFYHGAQHAGTAKNTFIDSTFAAQYKAELLELFLAKGEPYWADIANMLADDIKNRYASYYGDQPLKKADALRVYMDLNYSNNFHECRSQDNTKTELYIVEGTSAGNIISGRDPDFQAIYTTQGKPKNVAVSETRKHKDIAELLKNPIYQDLMRILNVTPNTTDMSSCRFSKIIIATDADPDGYHIGTLHQHNLYLINPLLITQGYVYVANPPLYSYAGGNSKRLLFLRNKGALIDAKIEFIYKKAIDMIIVTDVNDKISEIPVPVNSPLYRDTCYIVNMLGEAFSTLAHQLDVDILILERLVYAIDCLYPTIDYNKLTSFFAINGSDVSVKIDKEHQYLVISIGEDDYPVCLNNIGEIIKNNLLQLTNRYKYRNLYFKIKGKTSDTEIRDYVLITPMQLYQQFVKLDKLVDIKRYKGLGQMPNNSCYETLMNPETRSLTRITTVGDASTNYGLVGKKTVQYRKELMSATGSLSTSFRRNNNLFDSWLEVQ